MKKKHIKLLCSLLSISLLIGLFVPAFAEGEDPGAVESPPVVESIDINANYYAEDAENAYSIIFTVMEEIPAFTQLSMKIRLENATVNQASFESAFMTGNTAEVGRYTDYAIYPLTYTEARSIPAKTRLCTLTVNSEVAPSAANLFISDFTIVKENELEPTALTADVTVAEGPIIPELNAETQAVYDAICALPDPTTLSFYQENGALTDLASLQETVTSTKAAHIALSNAQKNDLDAVLEFNEKSTYALDNLPSVLQAMCNIRGLVEIAAVTKDITEDMSIIDKLSYQFLIAVFDDHSNISLQGLLPDSTARQEASQLLSTLNGASEILQSALESASQEADGGYKTRTYACQDQLSKIQSFSSHKYYSEYMANLEEQIDTLIDEVESALDSDPIGQKALLDSLKTSRSTIQLIMEGMGDLPTMKVDGINQRNRYTISFKRKKTLDDSLSASISVVVTDKEGTEIDTAQKDFDADSLELKISFNAPATKYTKGEMYTITAYYHINDADYLIDSQEHECYYIRTTQSGGLGGNGGSSSNLGNTGGDDTNTPTTGGTIFPDSNDDPETPTTPKTTFNDLKDYT